MTRKIFRAVILAALAVFAVTVVLIFGVLYSHFSGVQLKQLRAGTELAAQGTALLGMEYLRDLETDDFRITWIAADGTVLYDNRTLPDHMENHMEREEILEATVSPDGRGESSRYSETMMKNCWYTARRLPDGGVLRMASEHHSVITLLFGMLQPMLVITVFIAVFAVVLASRTAKKIVTGLNDLDLDRPLTNAGYEELTPLLRRLEEQQQQLRVQESELQRKQKEFAAVTDNMSGGLILLDARGHILSINAFARRLLKASPVCIGQELLSVCGSPEMRELLQTAQCGVRAEKILEADGLRYEMDITPVESHLPDLSHRLTGYVILMFDVTEKEKSEQMRREFSANVSHELKTPLHSISGCAELLSGGLVRPEDEKQFLTQIYTEAQRMIRLVDDVIGLSRLDEGAAGMIRETVDLYVLAGQTVSRLASAAETAGVTVTLSGSAAVTEGIPQLLGGIIYNLCDNAIKYNKPGGSVSVDVRKTENGVTLSVADTGIGIPPEHQARVFERFYRVDKSHSKAVGGTGLGLSIVKHAVMVHNASVSLVSEPGRGTTVTVTFPSDVGWDGDGGDGTWGTF